MDPRRPRPSVLSLFDPLGERPESPDSDKENNVSEISFFHPPGASFKQAQTPVHKLRRRLIDVGDMTIDEPDIQDFLDDEDQLEAQINHSVAEDDDNDTLTFRDMAKAATPKWSARKASTLATPKSSPTPRTPLVEIPFGGEVTPMARKKTFKRPTAPTTSKLSEVETANTAQEVSSSFMGDLVNGSANSSLLATSVPSIEVSFETNTTANTSGSSPSTTASLGSSVCTLELATPSGTLINDTAIPVLISPSSPESPRDAPIIHSPAERTRLRPNSQANNTNRYSVDLQTSFQLQLNASETTFDLLNDRISFFSSNNGNNTFLDVLEEGPSFGDDAGFAVDLKVLKESIESPKNQPHASQVAVAHDEAKCVVVEESDHQSNDHVASPKFPLDRNFEVPSIHGLSGSTSAASSKRNADMSVVERAPATPKIAERADKNEANVVSTPISSLPAVPQAPAPVPALRIVKRVKTLLHPKPRASQAANSASGSRRTSSVTAVQLPASRAPARSSPEDMSSITSGTSFDNPRQATMPRRAAPAPTFSSASQSKDGPRRVLVSEGPKLNTSRAQANVDHVKATSTSSGPRRVVVAEEPPTSSAKAPMQASSGLRQPAKYATVGPASAIPKPVSRNMASRLPAPSANSTQRFGVSSAQSKGLQSRRVV